MGKANKTGEENMWERKWEGEEGSDEEKAKLVSKNKTTENLSSSFVALLLVFCRIFSQ